MTSETITKITDYVYKNYPSYKGISLIIREKSNCFQVCKHEDGSPLILGKKIGK